MLNFIDLTDGYKIDHRRQYPAGTQYVYSNFTPRASRVPDVNKVVAGFLQYALQAYFTELASATFFSRPRAHVCDDYQRLLDSYLGPNDIGVGHIAELHKLGYIPLEFWAVPEGTLLPLRMPMFTYQNTHPDFFWVTNYFETLLSSVLWQPVTSATFAHEFRLLLTKYAKITGTPLDFVDWQGHDFSSRGMAGPEAAALSGAGHLLSFLGTDTLPAVDLLRDYYSGGLSKVIGGSVPATEHAVMCAGGEGREFETISRLLDLYPKGILSVVSDTWDLWSLVDHILPRLKDRILAREGKYVTRPDSGNPVDILTGDPDKPDGSTARRGLVEALWRLFGGTTNEQGFRVLDPHVGTIYGDSINRERAEAICERLIAKGFATSNVVFGVGSYSYQYVTRDTYGIAMKATWALINGREEMLSKNPATDDGTKKSARGRIVIREGEDGELEMIDGLTIAEQVAYDDVNLLTHVWKDGVFTRKTTLEEVRARLRLAR